MGGRAGVSRGLQLGAPRAGRRSARLLHRLWRLAAANHRRPGQPGADQRRSSRFHRPCRRPPRRHRGFRPHRADAAARCDRQSRQPEHPGRPCELPGLRLVRRHLRLRPALQPPAGLRRRHRRPHRLPGLDADRRRAFLERRPQLQPVRRGGARLLRAEAGPETVRRGRGRHARARPAIRPQRLSARFQRRLCQGRLVVRILAAAHRRSRGRLGGAHLCRSAAEPRCRACSRPLRWSGT